MADSLDPYHEWLGIPASEQPADHYRLLGISRFEDNRAVISNAYEQRVRYVRTFQLGERAGFSQQLLSELASVRSCLLEPSQQAAYDEELRSRQAERLPPLVLPPQTRVAARKQEKSPVNPSSIVWGVTSGVIVGAIILWFGSLGQTVNESAKPAVVRQRNTSPSARSAERPMSKPTDSMPSNETPSTVADETQNAADERHLPPAQSPTPSDLQTTSTVKVHTNNEPVKPDTVTGFELASLDCKPQKAVIDLNSLVDSLGSWAVSLEFKSRAIEEQIQCLFTWGDSRPGRDVINISLDKARISGWICDCRDNSTQYFAHNTKHDLLNEWTRVTVHYDNPVHHLSVFVNGELVNTEAAQVRPVLDKPAPACLGGNGVREDQRFMGLIRSFWISNLPGPQLSATTSSSAPALKQVLAESTQDAISLLTFEPESIAGRAESVVRLQDSTQGGDLALLRGGNIDSHGMIGSGVLLDGDDDHILLSGLRERILRNDSDGVTIACWFKPDLIKPAAVIFDVGFHASTGIALTLEANQAVFTLPTHHGGRKLISPVQCDLTWQHIAGVWDGSEQRLYLNGVLVAKERATGLDLSTTTVTDHEARIGIHAQNRKGAALRHFQGMLDEFVVFGRAMTDSEVSSLVGLAARGESLASATLASDHGEPIGLIDAWAQHDTAKANAERRVMARYSEAMRLLELQGELSEVAAMRVEMKAFESDNVMIGRSDMVLAFREYVQTVRAADRILADAYDKLTAAHEGSSEYANIATALHTESHEILGPPDRLVSVRLSERNDLYLQHSNYVFSMRDVAVVRRQMNATLGMVPGLSNSSYVSFRSVSCPNYFLSHGDLRIRLTRYRPTDGFRQNATFKQLKGLANPDAVSFEAVNFPEHFIRTRDNGVYIEKDDGTAEFKADATFVISEPEFEW